MKKYFTFCIWNCGPGRPFDNEYVLVDKLYQNNAIVLSFESGEKCTIVNPTNIIDTETCLKIEQASQIIWSSYYYGKPQSDDTQITIKYETTENGQIRIFENGPFENCQMISMSNRIAFDSYIRTQM